MKVVIVGSGIVGSSAAYHLAKKGINVTVADYCHFGQATEAGAGIVCPWLTWASEVDSDYYLLKESGACHYPQLIDSLKEDDEHNIGYKMVGALAVSKNLDKLDELKKRALERKESVPEVGEVYRIPHTKAKELFPPLNEGLEAVYVTGAARVDGKLLRDALQRASIKRGANFINGIAALNVSGGKVTGVTVNDTVINADAIILATGAWTNDILAPFGIKVQIEPQRGQIIHLRLINSNTSKWPVVLLESRHYLVSFDDRRVVAGATRETGSGFSYRLTSKGVKEVLDEALTVAPGLEDATIHEMRIGFRPMSLDEKPLLGKVSELEGLVIATGLGPSGLTAGPYVGELAANLAINEAMDVGLKPFDPFRPMASKKS